MSEPVLMAESLRKSYPGTGGGEVLAGASLSMRSGESLAVVGASGCGKSTLLHMLGGLAAPDSGTVTLAGSALTGVSPAQQGRLRNRHLGFIYQMHHLLGEFSAVENVAMPLEVAGCATKQALDRARALLARLGMEEHFGKLPGALSGGERQRVAVARALVNEPDCVLADEPTGNLDRKSAAAVLDLLLEQCSELGCALLMATHDLAQASQLDARRELRDGRLELAR